MSRLSQRKLQVIKSTKTFDEIFRAGRKLHSEHLVLVVKASHITRVGFAVSKRIRGAVHRNRAKRKLREIVRINTRVLPTRVDLICMAKEGAERTKFETLNEEYMQLVGQLANGSAVAQ